MSLLDYKEKFKDNYIINTGEDVSNVINDFYIPALSNSTSYDRNAGYFSSSLFQITYGALPQFIKNNGKIKNNI